MTNVVSMERLREAQAELERRLVELKGTARPIPAEELEGLLMAKTKSSGETAAVAFRLDEDLLKRIDAHTERMTKAVPGVTFTRTDAVRSLLLKALDTEERRGHFK